MSGPGSPGRHRRCGRAAGRAPRPLRSRSARSCGSCSSSDRHAEHVVVVRPGRVVEVRTQLLITRSKSPVLRALVDAAWSRRLGLDVDAGRARALADDHLARACPSPSSRSGVISSARSASHLVSRRSRRRRCRLAGVGEDLLAPQPRVERRSRARRPRRRRRTCPTTGSRPVGLAGARCCRTPL